MYLKVWHSVETLKLNPDLQNDLDICYLQIIFIIQKLSKRNIIEPLNHLLKNRTGTDI